MADSTATGLEDVIVPEVFGDYQQIATAELSALLASGIAVADPALAALAAGGGDYVTLPHWGDLSGSSEVLPDGNTAGAALTPGQIAAGAQVSVKQWRGKAWAANDMAALVSGSDPVQAMAARTAAWWARDEQTRLIAILTGLFRAGGCLASTHVLDVSAGGRLFDGEVVLEGAQLLGDSKEALTAIAMHSAKHTSLQKAGLIKEVFDPQTGVLLYTTYLGKRVIIDDNCPYSAGVYTSYLFGAGALARIPVDAKVPVEMDRDALAGEDILIVRQGVILHPYGCSYAAAVGGRNPSNTTLGTATSWTKVAESKQIRMVAIRSA